MPPLLVRQMPNQSIRIQFNELADPTATHKRERAFLRDLIDRAHAAKAKRTTNEGPEGNRAA